MTALRIGFLGLGQMGQPMVRNLLRAGFNVTGFDLNPAVLSNLSQEAGFQAASSVQVAAASCDVLILMLPDSKVIDALL